MAEFLASMHIGYVHFDKRYGHTQQGVAKRDAGMRESARVYENVVHLQQLRLMDGIHQLVFRIALYAGDLSTLGIPRCYKACLHIRQGLVSIYRGFSRAQKIQIWAIQQENVFCHVVASLSSQEYRRWVVDRLCKTVLIVNSRILTPRSTNFNLSSGLMVSAIAPALVRDGFLNDLRKPPLAL